MTFSVTRVTFFTTVCHHLLIGFQLGTVIGCADGEWQCIDGSACVQESDVMNGQTTCTDGSDENPQYHVGRNCSDGGFRCASGECIPLHNVCDVGVYQDCSDDSDEGAHCHDWNCDPDYFKCADGLQCIHKDFVCDGINFQTIFESMISFGHGCKDKSDEHNSLCPCPEDGWPCDDGDGCVNITEVCDENTNCKDGSDEIKCGEWQCPAGYWQCDDRRCIKSEYVCDGRNATEETQFGCKDD